jgi:hypothetical protein
MIRTILLLAGVTLLAQEQTSTGKRPALPVLVRFDGLGAGFDGPQGPAAGRNPSDNSLAAGPRHVVQTVNSRLAVFDKTGKVLYGAVPTNSVFKGFGGICEQRQSGDAVVRYDQLANRWLLVLPIFQRIADRPEEPTASATPSANRTIHWANGIATSFDASYSPIIRVPRFGRTATIPRPAPATR